jgi:hypothetical protein
MPKFSIRSLFKRKRDKKPEAPELDLDSQEARAIMAENLKYQKKSELQKDRFRNLLTTI